MEIGAKTEWMDNRLRFNVAAYLMDWDDFAVQIEDPQPGVFQLGYVNLPTAEIPGVEAELTFVVNDAWQIDATLGYNDAQVSEATTLTLTDDDGVDYVREVEDGARLPLTPDWSGALGVEWRPRGQLLNSQPFARVDLAYVGEVRHQPRGLRVRRRPGRRQHPGCLRDGRLPRRARGRGLERLVLRGEPVGRAGGHVPQQPLGGAATDDSPAAHLRAAVPLRILTAAWTSARRSATSGRSTWRRSAPPSSRRTRPPGTRTSSGRRTTRSTSRRARSCSCSRTSTTGPRSRWRSSRAGSACPRSPCRSCTTSSAGSTRRAARSSARWRRSCSPAGASCRTAIRTRPSASGIASTCRSSPTRACAS